MTSDICPSEMCIVKIVASSTHEKEHYPKAGDVDSRTLSLSVSLSLTPFTHGHEVVCNACSGSMACMALGPTPLGHKLINP
jgi:hypothetical protein